MMLPLGRRLPRALFKAMQSGCRRSCPPSPSPRLRGAGDPVGERLNLIARFTGRRHDQFFVAFTLLCLLMLMIVGAGVRAQENDASDNDVIRVAERMYCPVCENIPLDECDTIACVEWKEEIRKQLADGRGDQEIINSFVARFGDHVVGVPQDPVLRALTLIMPLLATAFAVAAGVVTFRRFGKRRDLSPMKESVGVDISDENYRQQLEADVQARR